MAGWLGFHFTCQCTHYARTRWRTERVTLSADPGRFEALITWSLIALIIFHFAPAIYPSPPLFSISFSICIHFHFHSIFFFLRHLHSVSFFTSPVSHFFFVVCPVFYPLVFFNLQPGIFQLGRQKSPVFHLCIFRFTSFLLVFQTESQEFSISLYFVFLDWTPQRTQVS